MIYSTKKKGIKKKLNYIAGGKKKTNKKRPSGQKKNIKLPYVSPLSKKKVTFMYKSILEATKARKIRSKYGNDLQEAIANSIINKSNFKLILSEKIKSAQNHKTAIEMIRNFLINSSEEYKDSFNSLLLINTDNPSKIYTVENILKILEYNLKDILQKIGYDENIGLREIDYNKFWLMNNIYWSKKNEKDKFIKFCESLIPWIQFGRIQLSMKIFKC